MHWTVRDLKVLPRNRGTRYELIGGELFVVRALHRQHQQVSGRIYSALDTWSVASGLGEAIPAPGIVPSDTDNVIPDAVWVSKERLACIEDEAGYLVGFPELVVEVLSPGKTNIRRDRETKLELYSARGVREYWIADRFAQRLEVYRRRARQLVLMATLLVEDDLTSPLLCGFRCSVSRFFA